MAFLLQPLSAPTTSACNTLDGLQDEPAAVVQDSTLHMVAAGHPLR